MDRGKQPSEPGPQGTSNDAAAVQRRTVVADKRQLVSTYRPEGESDEC